MNTIGARRSYYYRIPDQEGAADFNRSVFAERPIERWLVEAVTKRLRDVANPFVEAALQEVPAPNGPAYHRRLQFGDPHSEKGGSAWSDSVSFDGHTVNFRFLVEYLKDEHENRLTQLQVNAYYDKPIDDHRVADLYVWIGVENGQATSIRFGGKDGTPLSDMPDNYIGFDENGIYFTGWRYERDKHPVAVYRTYEPSLDTFVAAHEQDGLLSTADRMATEDVLRIATEALKIIPTEEDRT